MKVIEHKTCFDLLYKILPETFLTLRTERDTTTDVHTHRSSCKVPAIVRFQWNVNFLDRFSKIFKHQI